MSIKRSFWDEKSRLFHVTIYRRFSHCICSFKVSFIVLRTPEIKELIDPDRDWIIFSNVRKLLRSSLSLRHCVLQFFSIYAERSLHRIKIYTTNFPIERPRNLRLLPFNGIFAIAVSRSYVYENKWKRLLAGHGINVVVTESDSHEKASFFKFSS